MQMKPRFPFLPSGSWLCPRMIRSPSFNPKPQTLNLKPHSSPAFTLIELLVVLVVIGILVGLTVPAIQKALNQGRQAASLSNIRQIGMSMLLYAADHGNFFPPRTTTPPPAGEPSNKWPRLLYDYMPDVRAYTDPSDPKPKSLNPDVFFPNNRNNSSYIFNGFNDLGTMDDPTKRFNMALIASPSSVILFSKKRQTRGDFYMDVLEGSSGNHIDVLDWVTYGQKLHYFFADGSARWLNATEYRSELWLVDKSFELKK
jgi:prepilin-type N-terminal cleavage/methylation domain-containing protein